MGITHMAKVSELLKERMSELKISADEVANYCGVNRATVYRWLNGEIDNMRWSNIASLAQILRLDPALIVGNIDDDTKTESDSTNPKDFGIPSHFNSAQDAISFILRQPLVADYGGYDLSKMSDEDIVAFANEIAGMIQYAAKLRNARKEQEGETTWDL